MSKLAVVGIVEFNNKILIGKKTQTQDLLSQEWHIPGGKVQANESEEKALRREILEEADISIKITNLIDEFYIKEKNMLVKWFLCKSLNSDIKAGSDLEEVKFVSKTEIRNYCGEKIVSLWPKKVVEYLEK